MFGRIAERGMGRSGCSLSWLAVDCQPLISHTAPANALFNIHLGKFNDSHISIWLSAAHPPPSPSPPAPQPTVPACSLRRQGSAGTHPELSISQSQPPGLGAGEGQIKACFGALHLPYAHLKSASQRGRVMPSLRLPLATPYPPIRGTGPP